jgi:hypothetical protein
MTTFRTIDIDGDEIHGEAVKRFSLYMFDFGAPVGFRWPRAISSPRAPRRSRHADQR